MDSNYCICVNEYLNQLESIFSSIMRLRLNSNFSATDSGYMNTNTANINTQSSDGFFSDNSLMIFCVLLLGLIYFLGTYTGGSSQRNQIINTSSLTPDERIEN